jgi:peptidoglycan hydrolase-like protein with peptidoglycan-binding domain
VSLGILAVLTELKRDGWDVRIAEEGAERNERSTPRAFILPATPAVTREQEEQAREAREGLDVFRCQRRLRKLGYQADDTPPVLRAQNLSAIFRFQQDHGLAPSARFDPETVRMLRCQS